MRQVLVAAAAIASAVAAAPALADEAAAPAVAAAECELHVWPTENYIGMNSGLLSGFGIVGALADDAAHKDRVRTVKELMADYLGPQQQLDELNKLGLLAKLKLPATYRIVVEEPTPWNEDVKKDPALKAKVKEMNATIKAGKRLGASTNPCYAELIGTNIFYMKAMMYGSNLFAGWVYREYDGAKLKFSAVGAVKNPLEDFPAKTPEKIDAAKAELRDAYAKDFAEYVQKKVKR